MKWVKKGRIPVCLFSQGNVKSFFFSNLHILKEQKSQNATLGNRQHNRDCGKLYKKVLNNKVTNYSKLKLSILQ